MRILADIRLPERLADRVPVVLTQALVGLAAALVFLALRVALQPLTGDIAPYALSFLAVVLASLVAGWRSGLVALAMSQALTWYLLVPPFGSFAPKAPAEFYSFLLASGSQLFILLIVALYQREVRTAQAEREGRIDFLSHALREIDHRTHNNFQTVLGLLVLQSRQSADPAIRAALAEASDRVKAVSLAYGKLALSSEGIAAVRLQDHLQELCDQLSSGIVPSTVELQTEFAPITVPAEEAICVGIIVNELVTNAVKHAFPDHVGTIRVSVGPADSRVVIEVADDGCGIAEEDKRGLGSRLIDAFMRRLGGTHDVLSPGRGTVHRIMVPVAAGGAADQRG